jgi:hypothetical protein
MNAILLNQDTHPKSVNVLNGVPHSIRSALSLALAIEPENSHGTKGTSEFGL